MSSNSLVPMPATSTGSHMVIPQVVKVFATQHRPDFHHPWARRWTEDCTGSGVFVGPGEILTNAHVVADATFLEVQKVAEPEKVQARVKATCHDADLALLSVDDERFLRGTSPVPVGELTSLRDKVVVAGFPMGGDQLSVTEGVVSRVEVQTYSHSGRDLLAVTIDAAINPGNSGGPVFQGGQIAGLAFQKTANAEAMGAMVPAPLIRRFLEAHRQGRDSAVPGLGWGYQRVTNPALRRRLAMSGDESGCRISVVPFGGSGFGHLRRGDVLLEVDGLAVGSEGTVLYRGRFRTDHSVILGDHLLGEEVEVVVLREGQRVRLRLPLQPYRPLVLPRRYDRRPSYFIYAGLVFQPLGQDYLRMWGDEWWRVVPPRLSHLLFSGFCSETQQEVVVLSTVLAHGINVGYDESSSIVVAVNGRAPRDMVEFVRMVEESGERVEIELENGALLVFDPAEVRAATPEILGRYDVPRDRSFDLLPAPVTALA